MQTIYQSPRDALFLKNPFPFYQRIRSAGEIVEWGDYSIPVTSHYELVNKILRDKRFVREPLKGFFSDVPKKLWPFYENESRSMLEREPPYHTKLKSVLLQFFNNKALREFEKEIETICSQLLKKIKTDEFDLINEFSKIFPVIVIARFLGVPEQMAPQLVIWSNSMVAMYQARRNHLIEKKAVAATKEFSKYIADLIKIKRKKPKNDLISYLLTSNQRESRLSDLEIISTIILLLNAGHEATVHTISNGLKAMIESKYSLADMVKNPKNLSAEILRFATPLHMFTRYSYDDLTIGECSLKKGDKIGLLLAAANRDPNYFDNPEEFNPIHKRKNNLSLGAGIHFCLGAHLANLELQVAIPMLIDFFPNIKISIQPEYADNFHFYGLKELIVKR